MAEINTNNLRRPEEIDDAARARAAVRRGGTRRRSKQMKFNLFDLLIIVAIVAFVALLATGVQLADLLGTAEQGMQARLTYTLTLSDVDQAYANSIKAGDTLYDTATKAVLGVVKQAPTSAPHELPVLVSATDGTTAAVMRPVPGRVDVTMQITSDSVYREGVGYAVNGTTIRVGESYGVRTSGYTGKATCTAFNGAVKIQNKEAAE